MKTCLVCQTPQRETEFSLSPTGRGGLHPWCKTCVRAYSRARYLNKVGPARTARKSATKVIPVAKPLRAKP